jgi:hypothetical protein
MKHQQTVENVRAVEKILEISTTGRWIATNAPDAARPAKTSIYGQRTVNNAQGAGR